MNQINKKMNLSKAFSQSMPVMALKDNLELTYEEITAKIMERVDGYDDAGQIEVIKGDWCFCVDFRVRNCIAEYWCPMLFHDGDEVKCPWTGQDFDYDCQPDCDESKAYDDLREL